MPPSSLEPLLQRIPENFTENERADALHELKKRYPNKPELFDQGDLDGALTQLNVLGAIDDGDTKLLEMLAEKSSKKDQVLELIKEHKSSLPIKKEFIGRDNDVDKIIKTVKRTVVPGVNLFGESGVGKTTLAKEVCKQLKDFETLSIDLRDIKDVNTVYFSVLQELGLASWDYDNKRIYEHLKNLTRKTLVFLDNVEDLLLGDQEMRAEFLEFLKAIISTEASKNGRLKVVLTSKLEIKESSLKAKMFTEYKVEPFSKEVSKVFISKRVNKDLEVLGEENDKALTEICKVCRDTPYLLQGAEQLIRQNYCTPEQVLGKISRQIKNGVPKEFASISALFDAIPSDQLKQVAVKISLLRRPFSVSTAVKIAEIESDYDARFDLEMLVVQKIITAEDVEGKRKYDLHALFREFVSSYLCKIHPSYKEVYEKAEQQFVVHFSEKLTNLAENLDIDFVKTFTKLEKNRPNFEKIINIKTYETFDLLLRSRNLTRTGLISFYLKYLINNKERRELFQNWAEKSEIEGNLLTSAYMRCFESRVAADMEGPTSASRTLSQAGMLLKKAATTLTSTDREKIIIVKGMYLLCKGEINFQNSDKLIDKSAKTKKKRSLHEALSDLNESLAIHKKVYGEHTLTARTLDLIGNCHMNLDEPEKAETFYKEAMSMKLKLVGSEMHDEIVHYYNQLSQVHQTLGHKIMKDPFELKKMLGRLLPYEKRAKQQFEKAAEMMKKALDLQKELGISDTEDTATFQRNLANIKIALGEYDEALAYAEKSCEIRKTRLGQHPDTVRILYLIGIIHEWRKDHNAALQSYEKAFEMEESLPAYNHSIVRKLLCDRLKEMCKKTKRKDKLKEYEPRIKEIRKIKDLPPGPLPDIAGPLRPFAPGEAEKDDDVEMAVEAKEEEADTVSHTEPGTSETEHPVQSELPGVTLPIEDTTASHTEPGTAETELTDQSSLPGVTLPTEDATASHTEPGTAETELTDQSSLPGVTLPTEDATASHTEPGTAETEDHDQSVIPAELITNKTATKLITIDKTGGSHDISRNGILLDVPPNAVTKLTQVTCAVGEDETLPSPARRGETVVSYMVLLEPFDLAFSEPITATLIHSGPGKKCGYENIVKAFNQEQSVWDELKESKSGTGVSKHCRTDYIQVQINKLTALVVISRLITDRFEVTPSGCVVRSSVCNDVTLEFPEGAVDKTVNGTMKLLPMPKNIHKDYDVYPCPILFIKGFENIELKKVITIQMLHPCPTRHIADQVKLLRLKNNQWAVIESQDISVDDSFIRLRIQHFCGLWLMIPVGTATVAISALTIYSYLSHSPQQALIAALKRVEQPALKMTLLCLANHEQGRLLDYKELGFMTLDASTVDELRPGDEAHPKIEGSFEKETRGELYLKFNIKEPCWKSLHLCRKRSLNQLKKEEREQKIYLLFFKKGEEESPLCEFIIPVEGETKVSKCNKPVEYFGISIETLREIPEDIIEYMPKYFKENDKPDKLKIYMDKWTAGGAEEFFENYPREPEGLQNLLEILQNKDLKSSSKHFVRLLEGGQKLVKTSLKDHSELKEKAIDVVSKNLSCSSETLADCLKIDKRSIQFSSDNQQQTSQMLKQWIDTSVYNCTIDHLFEVLRLCGDREAGRELARFTTEKSNE